MKTNSPEIEKNETTSENTTEKAGRRTRKSPSKATRTVIYQMLPRLFGNTCTECVANGDIFQNGCGKLNDITPKVLDELRDLGITHVWYTGIIEHAQATDYSEFGIRPDNPMVVKGKAGSPYAIKDYYDIDPDVAVSVPDRMKEFEELVDRTHKAGLKVVIDFVPNHVARRYHSDAAPKGIEDFGAHDDVTMFFSPRNNFYYIPRQMFQPQFPQGDYCEFPAKASGNDCFNAFPSRNDWYETVKLNYGVDYGDGSRHFDPIPDTWFKMLHILRYWAAKGIDAFRCDMVFMVPLEFWEWAIPQVKATFPDVVFIAEIYDVGQYRDFLFRGGFDYLYDKVNLYDTLRAVQCYNHSAATITDCWQRIDGIGNRMLNFLENHDEQRFASEQYAGDAAKVLPSLVVSSMISNAPFMIYAGQELGEKAADAEGFSGYDGRTTIFDYWSIPSVRRWLNEGKADGGQLSAEEKSLHGIYRTVLRLLNSENALSEGDFFDLMYVNFDNPHFSPHTNYAFLRHSGDTTLLIAVNFSDAPAALEINIPALAFEMYGIKPGKRQATELLSRRRATKKLSPDEPFTTDVAPWGAVIWKMK
ncbi:MAG: alpha-amylase [Muribaculaceae bacterium]|nr:alpha-amylase [Muribaculaceae bacterium]